MILVPRSEWGAPAETPAAVLTTALGVDVHWIGGSYTTPAQHGNACAAQVRAIRQEHLSDPMQHWVDIAYNFVVCQHGVVYEGRGLHRESGANGNQTVNMARYAVCAIQGTDEKASDSLKAGLRDAIEYLQSNGAGNQIRGHRDDFNTDCPGDELYAWVQGGALRPGESSTTTTTAPVSSHPSWPGRYLTYALGKTMVRGDDVKTWQRRMADRGWRIAVDGWYGPSSAAVAKAFQYEKGLTADGIIGPVTWDAAWTAPIS